MLQDACALLAKYTKTMRIIHHQPGLMTFTQSQQFGQGRDRALHAEHTVRHHELGCRRTARELTIEREQIITGVDRHTRTR